MVLLGFLATILALCSVGQTGVTTDNYPGLDFLPRPNPANKEDTLIYYKSFNEDSSKKFTSQIDQFLEQYKGVSAGARAQHWKACSATNPPSGEAVCEVSLREFGPCNTENFYGYMKASPCVFLKLDKILNWTPNLYNTWGDLPIDMPSNLREHIRIVEQTDELAANSTVWVSCEGENPVDVEFIGPVEYYPQRGFPAYYFPVTSTNQEDYLSPLVAVHFKRPALRIVINIECKAWAKNILHDRYERRGSVHFELMVD